MVASQKTITQAYQKIEQWRNEMNLFKYDMHRLFTMLLMLEGNKSWKETIKALRELYKPDTCIEDPKT